MATRLLRILAAVAAAGMVLLWASGAAGVTKSLMADPLVEAYPEIANTLRGALLTVALAEPESRQGRLSALAKAGRLRLADGRLEIEALARPGRALELGAHAEGLGGVCGPPDGPDGRVLSCFLPPEALLPLARSEDVVFLRPPTRLAAEPAPTPAPFPDSGQADMPAEWNGHKLAGAVLTEGILASSAVPWIQKGIRGTGVKVGVIDSGFEDYPDRQAEGELPAGIVVKNFVAGESQSEVDGTTKHGVACAEIIHDLAPGSLLYFAKVQTPLELGQAFTWLMSQGVMVISASIGFHGRDPGDGTGYFPDLAAFAEAGNIVWVASAGNERRYHYDGAFNPLGIVWSGIPITAHLFEEPLGWLNVYGESTTNPEMIDSFNVLSATLRWSDWGAPTMDLDLFLAMWDPDAHGEGQGDWRVVAESINAQGGGADDAPVEEIDYVTSDDATKYGFFVRSYQGGLPENLELFTPRATTGRIAYVVGARSLNNMAQVRDILAVGSMPFDASEPNDYSSEGPANGPGGTREGGFGKPDLCGYEGVSTVSYGFRAFTGTSAAAPHVAGAAALVREKYPAWTARQVRDYLSRRAIDIGPAGFDARCGYGRLHLGLPPSGAPTWMFKLLIQDPGG